MQLHMPIQMIQQSLVLRLYRVSKSQQVFLQSLEGLDKILHALDQDNFLVCQAVVVADAWVLDAEFVLDGGCVGG